MNFQEFQTKLKESAKPVIAYFWAPWCAPCRVMKPSLKKVTEDYAGRVNLWEINADEHPDLVREANVMGIPALLVFQGDQELTRLVGMQPAQRIGALFEAALAGKAPVSFGPTRLERLVRLGLAIALFGAGFASGPSIWLLLFAGVVGFSAVYDRCPIWRAIYPRLKGLLQHKS